MSDLLRVIRGEFSMEDPWATPRDCEVVRLRRSTDGSAPRLPTTVSLYFDSDYLNVVFSAADDHIVATMSQHDSPIYQEDVVEVFLAPQSPQRYFEIEVSPTGTVFDAAIESPEGVRASMNADITWRCDGLVVGVRKTFETRGRFTVDTLLRIPFASLGRTAPSAGESWRANLFRIDRHSTEGDEYSSWRPTMRDPADFHVTAAFGLLKFQD